jgi:hypothetical protein
MTRKPSKGACKPPSSTGKVGFGNPPIETRFKKGQSGNPAGRPIGRKNFLSDLLDELNELVEVTEKGQKREISKQRALIKSAFAKAVNGDVRMLTMIFDKLLAINANLNPVTEAAVDPGDQSILDRFITQLVARRLRGGGAT